jgi:hypothetical protein
MAGRESLSLHRALFSISTAKVYLEDMIVDFPEMKPKINQWINRLSFVSNDAVCSMTPNGREIYRQEITKGDPLQFEHMFQLMAQMDKYQRIMIEKAAEALLKGELIITE